MPDLTPESCGWLLDEYDADRFWSRVNFKGGKRYLNDPLSPLTDEADECWLWKNLTSVDDYSTFKLHGVQGPGHRIAYRDAGNNLPKDLHLDHLCRVHSCVNPSHLEPVTHEENVRRGANGHITHCPSGHEYTPENTYVQTRNGRDARYCKVCLKASRRRSYLRKKALEMA